MSTVLSPSDFLPHLRNVRKTPQGYTCSCPWSENHKNGDKNPSFSISHEGVGFCFVENKGYSPKEIAEKLGVQTESNTNKLLIETYVYKDEHGSYLYERQRYTPKSFMFRSKINGEYIFGLKGTKQVPYRLDKLFKESSKTIVICEGEKDVHTLETLGFLATTTGSATSWKDSHKQYFLKRDVIILPDQDKEGIEYKNNIVCSLQQIVNSLKIVDLPNKDITEWRQAGGTKEQLNVLIENASNVTTKAISIIDKPICEKKSELVEIAYPKKGWLYDYVEYIKHSTDAPDLYHLISGLIGFSTAIGRARYISFGDSYIFPNLYCCIVNNSSVGRKSTVINSAKRILREYDAELITADVGTPEAFLEELAEKKQLLVTKHEFGGFMQTCSTKRYMAEWKPLLTELYDCPVIYSRKTRGNNYVIEKPFINLFAATTIDWFRSTPEDFGSGYLARFLFIPPDKHKPALPFPKKTDPERRKNLVESLSEYVPHDYCEIALSEEATKYYEEFFYENQSEKQKMAQINQLMIPWLERLNTYFLKLALLFELSINPRASNITEIGCEHAYWLLDHIRSGMKKLMDSEISFSRIEKLEKLLISTIAKKPGLLWSDISNYAHLSRNGYKAKEAREVMEGLMEKNKVIEKDNKYYLLESA